MEAAVSVVAVDCTYIMELSSLFQISRLKGTQPLEGMVDQRLELEGLAAEVEVDLVVAMGVVGLPEVAADIQAEV
jgi:hypothetical protein